MSNRIKTKKQIRDEVVPLIVRDAVVGHWLAHRINVVDRAATAGDVEVMEMHLFAARGYICALVNSGYITDQQHDDLMELLESAKNSLAVYGKAYWEQHVGFILNEGSKP